MSNKKQVGVIMVVTVMTSLFLNSGIANSELIQNTVSVGCAQSYTKGEDSGNPKVLKLKHCNKINGDREVNSHFHYAKHNKDVNENFIGAQGDTNHKFCAGKLDNYSLAYHINDYFIVCTLIGAVYGKVSGLVNFGSLTQNKSSLVPASRTPSNSIQIFSYAPTKSGNLELGDLVAGVEYHF